MDVNAREASERKLQEITQRYNERRLQCLEDIKEFEEVKRQLLVGGMSMDGVTVQLDPVVPPPLDDTPNLIADKICHDEAVPSDELVNFVKHLRVAEIEEGEILSIPGNVCMGGECDLKFLHGKLFIRKCYTELSDMLLNETEIPAFLIEGTPGIGKSFFSYYLIYRLIQLKKTIVWHSASSSVVVCITPTATHFVGNLLKFKRQLNDRSTWYIVDAIRPLDFNAVTLLVTSPDRRRSKHYENRCCTVRFMPVWNWEEIQKAYKAGVALAQNSPELELSEIEKLFRRWGGVPRYIFQHAHTDTQQAILEAVIGEAAVAKLSDYISIQDDDAVSHHMLHIDANTAYTGEFKQYEKNIVVFASGFARAQVLDKFPEHCRDEMLYFRNRLFRLPLPLNSI